MKSLYKYQFIVADNNFMIRQGMTIILKQLYNDVFIYQVDDLNSAKKILKSKSIQLLIIDINLPGTNSLNIISYLRKIQNELKILIFSSYHEDIYAIRYLSARANGYLNKLSSEEEIKNAITAVMNSGKYLSKNIQEKIMDSYIFKKPANPLEQLSNRELEVAKLMVDGYGNTEICEALNIQKTTVSTYKTRIFEKTGVDNLSYLIQLFNLYWKEDR